ncbi:MAG: 3D domain-containing protein [Candidatus Omnitrophota bacterium]
MLWFADERPSLFERLKRALVRVLFLITFLLIVYYVYWGSHLYKITAYCDCPICVDIPEFRDGRFASGKKAYWGGVAADPSVRFGSRVELMPLWPSDWMAVFSHLKGRKRFTVEDRGGKIKGKDLDIYFPQSKGGHKAAKRWGVRYMRLKINGKFAP